MSDYQQASCRECGASYGLKRKDGLFCSPACRQTFHNRRRERGALLYDLFMINRHERKFAAMHKVWFLITRLAMYWRQQDEAQRQGRKSWLPGRATLDQAAWARATVVEKKKPRK